MRATPPDSVAHWAAARRTARVRNTEDAVSDAARFEVCPPAPTLTAVEPGVLVAGRDTTVDLSGDRFAPDARVKITFAGVSTFLPDSLVERLSHTLLRARIPGAVLSQAGSYSLRVEK